jgi:hypothetical protein
MPKFPCPCCGYLTLDEERVFDICPVCFWEDDNIQFDDPNYRGGANDESLNEARENFSVFRASEKRIRRYVRDPLPEELP